MAGQSLTRFDPDKKSAVLRQRIDMHRVTRLLKSFKSPTNRFAPQFYGEFNWKYGQIRLLCPLGAVMLIYLRKI